MRALAAVAVVEVEVVRVAIATDVEELLPTAGDDVATAPAIAIGAEAVHVNPVTVAGADLAVDAAAGVGDTAVVADVEQQQFGSFYRSPNQDYYSLVVEGKCCFEQQLA